MKAPLTQSKIQQIVIEIQQHHGRTGEPVSLNELPLWKPLTKSKKIKTGRAFKKMVVAKEVEGIRFVGVRKDNHSTYVSTNASGASNGGGFSGFFRRLFG